MVRDLAGHNLLAGRLNIPIATGEFCFECTFRRRERANFSFLSPAECPSLGITKGATILCIAAQRARPEMVSLLLQLGAKSSVGDITGKLPLHYAALGDDRVDNVRTLLNHYKKTGNADNYLGARDRVMRFTPLMW